MSRVVASQYNIGNSNIATVIHNVTTSLGAPARNVQYRQYYYNPATVTKVTSITVYIDCVHSQTVTLTFNGSSASRSVTSSGWYTFTFSSPVSVTPSTGYNFYLTSASSYVGLRGSAYGSGGYIGIDGGTTNVQSFTWDEGQNTVSWNSFAYYVNGYGIPQSLQATTVSGVGYNTATLSSGVYDDNGDVITRSGFLLSYEVDPPPYPASEIWVSTGMANFETTPTTLAFGTLYYVRSYAVNSAGVSYGARTTFTTPTPVGYVSATPIWTIEQSLVLTLANAGNLYLQAVVYVNGVSINTWNIGQVTSATLGDSGGAVISALAYAQMPNVTSASLYVDILTYSDSGYTTQVGATQRGIGTVYVNQTINKPTFTTFTTANVDKNVVVVDKYGNTLITSSTSTLLGSDTKMIKGVSKLRSSVTSANKMVAKNYATNIKYRFVDGALQSEVNYSAGSTVTMDIDNALVKELSVSAIDSRNLSTVVTGAMANMVEPTPISLWGLTLIRDNNIDPKVKLAFSGSLWKNYFGGGANGVLNAVVIQSRFKRTTHTWGSLDKAVTSISNGTPCLVTTPTPHGLVTGDIVWFSTTGALPTGLTKDTTMYYAIVVNSTTYNLASSYANALAGTKLNTTGAGSGTHTQHADSIWTTVTPTDDGVGNLTYNSYINGDLGASGFNTDKSYTVEVRAYDKISQTIIEGTISLGIPLMDWTKNGIGIGGQYSSVLGGALQVTGAIYDDGIKVPTISSTDALTNKTIDGDLNTVQDLPYSAIKSTSRGGVDAKLITGTPGANGTIASWNADGDLVTTSIYGGSGEVYPVKAYTLIGAQNLASGTTGTLFAFPAGTNGGYLVFTNCGLTGEPNAYNTCSIVIVDSGVARIVTLVSASNHTVSMSGLNFRAVQGSGIALTITGYALRIM